MKMVRHQTIGMNLKAGLLTGFAQCFQEKFAILVLPKNCFVPVDPIHHLINRSQKLNADFSWRGSHPAPHSERATSSALDD
jgi:hypothetical protein